MYCKKALSAVTALAFATGAFGLSCDDDTVTVKSTGDASALGECGKYKGSVTVDKAAGPNLDFSGLQSVGGDFTVQNNKLVASIMADDLRSIGGKFTLDNLISLTSLSLSQLGEVQEINFATLTKLPSLGLGNGGITKADKIVIGDTFLDSIEGINVVDLQFINLNNNKRLTKFKSGIQSVSDQLLISANGLNLTMEMDSLNWISNMTVGNVTSFSASKLKSVNGSIRFDSNYFQNFALPKLQEIQEGDLAIVSNAKVTNISLPALEKVGGGFTVANNTKLEKLDGFPKLESVGGAIALRGSWTSAELPSLKDVTGGFELVSTADLDKDTCSNFQDYKSNGVIQGPLIDCKGNDEGANDNTDGAGSGSGSGGDGKKSAAGFVGVNTWAVVSLAALGAYFTTL